MTDKAASGLTSLGLLTDSDTGTHLYGVYGGNSRGLHAAYKQSGSGAVPRTLASRLRQVVSVKDFGALADGSNDTAAITAALAAHDVVYAPAGTYRVTNLTIAADKTLLTDGYKTIFYQLSGQDANTPIIAVSGSRARLGSCKVKGNISTDTGEQIHAVKVYNASASISDIEIGDILGEDIRGDVLYIGAPNTQTLRNVKFGNITASNVYRSGVSIVGGAFIRGGHIDGAQVGYKMLNVEVDDSFSDRADNIVIASVRGGFVQLSCQDNDIPGRGIVVGHLHLDPSFQANSTPTNSNYSTNDALTYRNTADLRIGTFKCNGHARYAIAKGGTGIDDVKIVIDYIEWSSITGSSSFLTQMQGVKFLEINGGRVDTSGKILIQGENADPTDNPVILRNIDANCQLMTDVDGGLIENCDVDAASATLLVRCDRTRIVGGNYNLTRIGQDCSDCVVAGGKLATSSDPWNSNTSDTAHYRHAYAMASLNFNGAGAVLMDGYVGHGVVTDNGDAAKTLTVYLSKFEQKWATTLTADRAVTLATTIAFEGAKFRIVRTAGGAFNLNVGTGPLKALAQDEWCEVTFNGTAWALTAFGTLSNTVQDLNGAGAVNLITRTTKWGTTGVDAGTLADGAQGQRKTIIMDADGGDGTLTPSNFGNGTTITFNDVGDCVELIFINADWWVVANNGCTVA